MNRTGFLGGNKGVGIVAVVLAAIMIVTLFLPMLALKNTDQLGRDLLDSATYGMLSGRAEEELLEEIRDAGIVRQIAHSFASVKLSSLGRESSGYGYYDDSLEDRIDDLDDTLGRYFDDIEDELYDLISYGETDFGSVMRMLNNSALLDALGEFLFCSLVYAIYDNGLDRTMNVKAAMTSIQRMIRALEDGKLSPVEMLQAQKALQRILQMMDEGVLSNSVVRLTSAMLESAIRSLKRARLGYGLLLALYTVSAIMALAGILLGSRRTALPGACCVTVFALINTIVAFFQRYRAVQNIRSQLGASLSVNIPSDLLSVTIWPVISVIVGLALTAIVLLLWQEDDGVIQAGGGVRAAGGGVNSARGRTAAGDWYCPQCGAHCGGDQRFCAECGTKRPEAQGWCPGCGARVGGDDLFCQVCGARLTAGGSRDRNI